MSDISKITEALFRLRLAFQECDISPPDVLEYSDTDAGYDALHVLRGLLDRDQSVQWVMDGTGQPYGEVVVAGFTLRFRPRMIERPGTGAELDDGSSGVPAGDVWFVPNAAAFDHALKKIRGREENGGEND